MLYQAWLIEDRANDGIYKDEVNRRLKIIADRDEVLQAGGYLSAVRSAFLADIEKIREESSGIVSEYINERPVQYGEDQDSTAVNLAALNVALQRLARMRSLRERKDSDDAYIAAINKEIAVLRLKLQEMK